MSAGGDIDHPGAPRLGVRRGLGQGRHEQVGQQEVAQVVGGHLGLVTILCHLPGQDNIRIHTSLMKVESGHLSPNMIPALLARTWIGVSRFRTASAKLRTLSSLRWRISNITETSRYILMIPHEVQVEADQGPREALLVLSLELVELGLH